MCVCVCPRVHGAVCGLHLSLCAIWNQSVVAVSPNPSVGSSQMAICKTWPSVGPLLRLTALPCTTAPLPHLSSPSSFHITRFTPFPHFHFHTSWAPCIAHCLPLSACLCPSVILPPLPSTCDLHSFIISLLFCISPYGLSICTCRGSHSKIFTLNCKLKDWRSRLLKR